MSELEKDLEGVVLANWLRMLEPSIVSTGVRTPSGRYDARGYALGARAAETFLVNSRLLRGDVEMALSIREHFTGTAAHLLSFLGRETRRGGVAVKLPTSVPLETSLEEAFRRRRSVRSYSGDALPLAQLATIIRAAAGLTNPNTSGEDGSAASGHRSVPSGGGLYPVDLHIAALRVETLPRATFVYDPHRDVLEQTGDESVVDALLASLAQPGIIITESKASAVCLLVGRPWRSMRKYGDRGMRYVFLEAGAMAEHISLAAVGIGIGDVHCGSFYDDEVHEAMGIDGLHEALIHSVFLGSPAPRTVEGKPAGGEQCPT